MKVRKFNGVILPKYVYVKKGSYLYFIKEGKCIALPDDPNSQAFYKEYAECLSGEKTNIVRKTMGNLIKEYQASDAWRSLAQGSKDQYKSKINYFLDNIADVDVRKIKRSDVINLQNKHRETPSAANRFVSVMSALLDCALDIDWVQYNVAKGVKPLPERKREAELWTEEEIQKFHEHAGPRESLFVELALNTGQRISDIVKMKWSDIREDEVGGLGIDVVQKKTKAVVFIPFNDRLKDALHRAHNQSDPNGYIITRLRDTQNMGGNVPIDTGSIRAKCDEVMKKCGFKHICHELRHTAASRLAELGLDDATIASITGHGSAAMVRKYTAKARQKIRARQAINVQNSGKVVDLTHRAA